MQRQYKIRKFQNGKNKDGQPFISYSMTIPADIAEQLPAELLFSIELSEDGILFRPSGRTSYDPPLPTWAEGEEPRMKDAPISTTQGQQKAREKRERPKRRRPKAKAA